MNIDERIFLEEVSLFLAGLFGCLEDVPTCVLGWFCSCFLFGQNAERITGQSKIKSCVTYALVSPCCLQCLWHKPQRVQLRTDHGLEEEPNDLIATCCCSACANCQEAREMNLRG